MIPAVQNLRIVELISIISANIGISSGSLTGRKIEEKRGYVMTGTFEERPLIERWLEIKQTKLVFVRNIDKIAYFARLAACARTY